MPPYMCIVHSNWVPHAVLYKKALTPKLLLECLMAVILSDIRDLSQMSPEWSSDRYQSHLTGQVWGSMIFGFF